MSSSYRRPIATGPAAESRFLRPYIVLVVSVAGILRDPKDPSSVLSYTDIAGLEELREHGRLGGGMLPKAASIRDALESGVERVHVISSAVKDSLLKEVFTNEGSGTLVVLDRKQLRPEEVASVPSASGSSPT